MSLQDLKNDIQRFANGFRAKQAQRYFKTGEGEYAEGDLFIGLTVPASRILAKKYRVISLEDCKSLLISKIHEKRLIALFILVDQFNRGDEEVKNKIYELYLSHTKYINNWDLVDSSAPQIVGEYLFIQSNNKTRHSGNPPAGGASRISFEETLGDAGAAQHDGKEVIQILKKLAQSDSLWERRIAIMATFTFIKHGDFYLSLKIAELLLADQHDLIYKAVGWMLREIGNRSLESEEKFLKKHYKIMPRTILRYAIEKFPEQQRKAYLSGKI